MSFIYRLRVPLTTLRGVRYASQTWRRFDAEKPPLTVQEMMYELGRTTGAQLKFDPVAYATERQTLVSVVPESQDDLPPRTQRDSYAEVVLPLSSDLEQRELFINSFKGIRTGRILECLDVFAVHTCFKYVMNPKQNLPSPFCIVTALVDHLSFRPGTFLSPAKDILLTGFVSWVGRTSMEVTMSVVQEDQEHIQATFVMVARDPLNRGSAVINRMQLDDDEDRKCFERGIRNMEMRKKAASESLMKVAPNAEESQLIHDLYLRSHNETDAGKAESASDSVPVKLMMNAKYSDITLCHPESRNRYNKIFGGFVMRLAYELAWASATSFCGKRVVVSHIDDIWFRAPVEVGSILQNTSVIGYTDNDSVLVRVRADVEDYKTGERTLTNTFYFVYKTIDASPVPAVLPSTYEDYMTYLDSRRHFLRRLAADGVGGSKACHQLTRG